MMKIAQICKLIDARKEELFDLLCRLIRINSESFAVSGNEEACARYIYELCQELGLDSEIYSPLDLEGFTEHPDYLPGRNLENRYRFRCVRFFLFGIPWSSMMSFTICPRHCSVTALRFFPVICGMRMAAFRR